MLALAAITSSATGAVPQNWTPTDESGAGLTLTVNSALYIKLGHITGLQFDVTYPATADGSAAMIGGVPRLPWPIDVASDIAGGGAPSYTDYGNPLTAKLLYSTGLIGFNTYAGAALTNANLSGKRLAFTLPCFLTL